MVLIICAAVTFVISFTIEISGYTKSEIIWNILRSGRPIAIPLREKVISSDLWTTHGMLRIAFALKHILRQFPTSLIILSLREMEAGNSKLNETSGRFKRFFRFVLEHSD